MQLGVACVRHFNNRPLIGLPRTYYQRCCSTYLPHSNVFYALQRTGQPPTPNSHTPGAAWQSGA